MGSIGIWEKHHIGEGLPRWSGFHFVCPLETPNPDEPPLLVWSWYPSCCRETRDVEACPLGRGSMLHLETRPMGGMWEQSPCHWERNPLHMLRTQKLPCHTMFALPCKSHAEFEGQTMSGSRPSVVRLLTWTPTALGPNRPPHSCRPPRSMGVCNHITIFGCIPNIKLSGP